MARNISAAGLKSMFDGHTSIVWLMLLTITHPDFAAPLLFVNNELDIVSNGDTYIAFPFMLELPSERDDELPEVNLTISNIDGRIMEEIRQISSAPTVTLNIISSNDLDLIEVGPLTFSMNAVDFNALTLTGKLAYEPILDQGYPNTRQLPSNFPGMF